MNEMTIDIHQGVSFTGVDDMIVKDLVVQSARGGAWSRHDQ